MKLHFQLRVINGAGGMFVDKIGEAVLRGLDLVIASRACGRGAAGSGND